VLATAVWSDSTLRFALLGLATGALTALVALAVVLVYRVSGVLNFAAGAFGAMGAFVCYSMRDDHGWPGSLALTAAIVVGAFLGVVLYGVMTLLRRSSLLTRLIATLALFSAAQAVMLLVWGSAVRQPKPLLPDDSLELPGGLPIGEDRLILIALALVLAVVLRLVYSGTLFGLATSAAAENRRVAASSGWSVDRIELVNFTIAGALAAMAATFLAPIVTLNAAVLSVAIIPALAAALVGRFSYFGVTVGAALAIGVLQSELALFQPDIAELLGVSTPSLTGLAQVVPLVIILIFTVMTGRARPARGEHATRLPLPGSGKVSPAALAIALVVGVYLVATAESYADSLIVTFGIAIIVCSVVVVTGYAGQLSLCQYAFAGFGAWVATKAVDGLGMPFLLAIAIGVISTVAIGVVVALPAIRTRGVSLAVVTLALALMFNTLVFTNAALTGGYTGIVVPTPSILGFEVDPILDPQRYAGLVLTALAGVCLVVANVRRGATGRQMIAVRSNERAAAALGISVVGVKLYAFGLGAGIAALGGGLLVFRQSNVQFNGFDVFGSIQLVQYAVIGGLGWVSGAIAGAVAAPGALSTRFANQLFPDLENIAAWLALLAGLGAVNLLRQAPDGMASLASRTFGRRLPRLRPSRARIAAVAEVPSSVMPSELEVRGIGMRFGGVTALDDVSLRIQPGEVLGLIGPNGAGKTTLLDVITGFTRPQAGAVLLDGNDISAWTPERRARAGMARSWQAVELFDEMTVRDNLVVACDSRLRRRYLTELVWPRRGTLTAAAERVVDDLGLRDVLDQKPIDLPHGVFRLVGIARAMVSNPTIVLLDEPAAGLDRAESAELSTVIRRIADQHGIGVIVIEHDMALILSTCDRIVVLDFGRRIAEGAPADIQQNADVIRAYLGATPAARATADVEATAGQVEVTA
jgi:ABC-type branched-subunit amino acid transport system ATPase component/ABC-type branched-subunit amino acid transport system permease subunit